MTTTPAKDPTFVTIDYKGASICVEIVPHQFVSLRIGNVPRETRQLNSIPGQSVRLSSSVQTDYEWHEFIVATVAIREGNAEVSILASNELILQQVVEL